MNQTRTFTITANQEMMLKIERFLSWMHFNTAWGHSATIAIDCDGDGSDRVIVREVEPKDDIIKKHRDYVYSVASKTKCVEWISSDLT